MTYKTYTYRVYPNSGGRWNSAPWQRGGGRGGLWTSLPWQQGEGRGGLWKSRAFMRGGGWGSVFGRIARKVLPVASKIASKGLKTLKNSKTLREVGRTLLDSGMAGVTEIAANAIEGSNKSAAETAQDRLDAARKDIANIIRKKGDINSSDTDASVDDYEVPVIKRRKPKGKFQGKKQQKRKKYNVLKNLKNVN